MSLSASLSRSPQKGLGANKREIIEELASSEGRFVRTLRAVCNAYLTPLRDARALATGEVQSIFRT